MVCRPCERQLKYGDMESEMKYVLAGLVIPIAFGIFIVVVALSVLYFGVESLLDRIKPEKISD